MIINAIIQCRMTSNRFPGKVLAPLLGKPLLDHVIEQIKQTQAYSSIILATSNDKADDPLANYAKNIGLEVVRGSRDNVIERYALALESHSCDAFFRVCGDSPLLPPYLLSHAVSIYKKKPYDIITNVFPRSYPQGMSVELIKTETFLKTLKDVISQDEREHISKYFYRNYTDFQIKNIECASPEGINFKLAVDEFSDLKNIESWLLSNKEESEKLFPIKFD